MKVHLKLLTAVLLLVPLNLMAASAPSAEGEKLNVCYSSIAATKVRARQRRCRGCPARMRQ